MKGRVIDIDHGWKGLKERLKECEGAYTKVGFHENAKRKDASPMVVIAAVHEFGNAEHGIPERSFLRATHDSQRANLATLLAAEYQQILKGKSTARRSLALVGEWFKAKVQTRIRSNIAPSLAEATLRRRAAPDRNHIGPRSTVALIDSGQLIQSIQHVEVVGGRK